MWRETQHGFSFGFGARVAGHLLVEEEDQDSLCVCVCVCVSVCVCVRKEMHGSDKACARARACRTGLGRHPTKVRNIQEHHRILLCVIILLHIIRLPHTLQHIIRLPHTLQDIIRLPHANKEYRKEGEHGSDEDTPRDTDPVGHCAQHQRMSRKKRTTPSKPSKPSSLI